MQCLCKKLQLKQYDSVTEDERSILGHALEQAPRLFQPVSSVDTRPPKKRTSSQRSSSQCLPRAKRTSPSRIGIHPERSITPVHAIPPARPARTTPSKPTPSKSTDKDCSTSGSGCAVLPPPPIGWHTEEDLEQIEKLKNGISDKPIQVVSPSSDSSVIVVRLYLTCLTAKLQGRLASYELARRHFPGSSLDYIVKEVLKHDPTLDENALRRSVTRCLRIGRVWAETCQMVDTNCAGENYIGLLAHITNFTAWEDARPEIRSQALVSLRRARSIHDMARRATPAAKRFLASIAPPFIDDTPAHARNPRIMSTMAHDTDGINLPMPRPRIFDADQPDRPSLCSDADKLLRLSCFFLPSHDIPVEMLRLGTTPRNRWTKEGSIATRQSSVHPHLAAFISDGTRMDAALHALIESGAISFATIDGHKTYKILPPLIEETLSKLEPDCIKLWRQQALLVSYHAVTWKYIESSTPVAAMIVPHLQHVLTPDGDLPADILSFNLAPEIAEDLVLTLAEAVRLPKIPWKVFAVNQARVLCRVGQSAYAASRVSENARLVHRLSKKEVLWPKDKHIEGTADPDDLRIHAAAGFTALQDCLDEMQREAFSKAEEILARWEPISPQPMAQAVLFRKNCLLGQIKRQQGLFPEAVYAVEMALQIANEHSKNGLYFDEDLPGLACSYADTLREQQSFDKAEKHLQWSLENCLLSFRSRSQIQASLVECLFAKGHKMLIDGVHPEARQILGKAEELCRDLVHLESERILRFDRLRTRLTLAKISFVQDEYVLAERRFQEAMNVINEFERTNGHATAVIIMSMIHTLHRSLVAVDHGSEAQLVRKEALKQSYKELETLKRMADPNGTRFWVPGLCEWEEWLSTQDFSRQSRL